MFGVVLTVFGGQEGEANQTVKWGQNLRLRKERVKGGCYREFQELGVVAEN